jgi:ATP-dependent Clp protease ATP-binding subunit ClpC
MINFDLKKSYAFEALLLQRTKIFQFSPFLKKLFLFLSLISFFSSTYLFILLAFFAYIFWYLDLFFNLKIKRPKIRASLKEILMAPKNYNLCDFFDFDCCYLFDFAFSFAKQKNIKKIDSSLLIYSLLKTSPQMNFVFYRLLLYPKDLLKVYSTKLTEAEKGEIELDENFEKIIIKTLEIASQKNKNLAQITDLLPVLAEADETFKNILIENRLKLEDVKHLCWLYEYLKNEIEFRKKFWEWENLAKIKSLGKEWAAGYTVTLDLFSYDVADVLRREGFKEIFAHKKTIEEVERTLAGHEKNDVLIVGEPGSGRKSIIEGLARKCALGQSLPPLNYRRVVWLDLPRLIASGQTLEEIETLLEKVFFEASFAGNIILVVPDLHNFVGISREGKREAGGIEITPFLAKYLPQPTFLFIGITTFEGFHKNISQRAELLNFFNKIEVFGVTPDETVLILEERALRLEQKYKVFVPFQTIREIINLTEKYQASLPLPEKAISLLDEGFVFASQTKQKLLLPKDVASLLSKKLEIPIGEAESTEREILLNLENLLHERIVDQEEAIKEISNCLRRARAEIKVRKGPIGSFLFLGPTGVGKTETAKALADIYFKGEQRMIRLDMSEFQRVEDIPRLIGSVEEPGLLTTAVRENPFSIVLLDEFEKSHKNIYNLFLQIFDEGWITDGFGRKVDFKNTMIIATSNAGAPLIFEAVKQKKDLSLLKNELIDFFVRSGIFTPELLNRFDGIIIYRPLDENDLKKIARLQLQKIQKQLKEKDIEFVFSEALEEKIAKLSYTPEFGAREMQRIIQEKIGDVLARGILEGKIKPQRVVEIDPENFQLKIL